ncbi:hypothetical protein CQW23_06563 [Capsicum baccatum]|uniref:SWIM-type domain-containing protein n=1 Tax=Capsicum baccatum TaxID=33114 RepID=A0A2G2X3R7_CAPBA|nr:hypothetical protein CQW23_06563 [Capsicum baccatum]
MKKVVLLVDYFGKWMDDKISWRWNSQNDTVRTMLVSGDVTFDKFMETIIRRGELSCGHDRICVKYMTNAGAFSRDRAPPVAIMNDEDVQIYLNDRNGEGGRPILRVSSIEKSLESGCGLSNHQSEDVLSNRVEKEVPLERDAPLDNAVDVQLPELLKDATIRSHHSYIFSDGSDAFCITRYAPNHSCDLRSIAGRYRHASAKVIAELIKERFRERKGPTPNEIKNTVSKELGCDVSYWTCWKAKQLSQNMIWGKPEHGYAKLAYTVTRLKKQMKVALQLWRNPSIKKIVAIVYNQAHHGVYTRHLGKNIRTNYHVGSSVLSLYYLAAKAYRIEEFNGYLEEIRRKGYGIVVEYLENVIGFKRWSRAHFPGQRWFREHRGLTLSTNNYLDPAENALVRETRCETADKLSVHQLHVNEFIVQGDGQDARVNINVKTCTCKLWDLQQFPCTHALAALRAQRLPNYGERVYNVCSPYYSADFHKLAYSEIINPIPPEKQWDRVRESIINPPLVKSKKGPRKKNGFQLLVKLSKSITSVLCASKWATKRLIVPINVLEL